MAILDHRPLQGLDSWSAVRTLKWIFIEVNMSLFLTDQREDEEPEEKSLCFPLVQLHPPLRTSSRFFFRIFPLFVLSLNHKRCEI